METTGQPSVFRRFAVNLYTGGEVGPACLQLQDRYGLDVNLVLFAAFLGAVGRRKLNSADITLARCRVDAWHRDVVGGLRTIRRGLKAGPAPAPSAATAELRKKVQQIEIAAELIELDELAQMAAAIGTESEHRDPVDRATHAIQTTLQVYGGPDAGDRAAIAVIAAAAAVDVGRWSAE